MGRFACCSAYPGATSDTRSDRYVSNQSELVRSVVELEVVNKRFMVPILPNCGLMSTPKKPGAQISFHPLSTLKGFQLSNLFGKKAIPLWKIGREVQYDH